MAARKSVSEKDDPRALETLRYVAVLKDSQPHFAELVKAVQKHQAQLTALSTSGVIVADVLLKIGEQEKGDLGESVKKVAEVQKQISEQLVKVAQAWTESIQQELSTKLNTDKQDVANFEKNYKGKRSASVKNLKKAESNQVKMNKPKMKSKNPEKAEEANAQLAQAEKEHDNLLAEQLREVVLLERKKYCHLLKQCCKVAQVEAETFKTDSQNLDDMRDALATISESEELLPENVSQILAAPPEPAWTDGASISIKSPVSYEEEKGVEEEVGAGEIATAQEVYIAPYGQEDNQLALHAPIEESAPQEAHFPPPPESEVPPEEFQPQVAAPDVDIAAALTDIDQLAMGM